MEEASFGSNVGEGFSRWKHTKVLTSAITHTYELDAGLWSRTVVQAVPGVLHWA